MLLVQTMFFNLLHPHRLKCSQPDVQGDFGNLDPALANAIEDLRREVQACSRRRHRSWFFRIDRLVAVAVGGPVLTRDIGRQWNMANPIYDLRKVGDGSKSDMPLAKRAPRDHIGPQLGVLAEEKCLTHSYLSAGTNETLPFIRFLADLSNKQDLDASLQKITRRGIVRRDWLGLRATSVAIKPRRKHARVVHHQEIVWSQNLRKIAKNLVMDSARPPVQVQDARGGAVGKRLLGDQRFGKIVVEVGNQHARLIIGLARHRPAGRSHTKHLQKQHIKSFHFGQFTIVGSKEAGVPWAGKALLLSSHPMASERQYREQIVRYG